MAALFMTFFQWRNRFVFSFWFSIMTSANLVFILCGSFFDLSPTGFEYLENIKALKVRNVST